jgi:hypothetical protein
MASSEAAQVKFHMVRPVPQHAIRDIRSLAYPIAPMERSDQQHASQAPAIHLSHQLMELLVTAQHSSETVNLANQNAIKDSQSVASQAVLSVSLLQ